MSAQDALVNLIAREDPALYEMLRTRVLPPGWTPDPTMTREVLATIKRDQCRTCETAGAPIRCPVCRITRYCNTECQRLDRADHLLVCATEHHIRDALKETLYAGHPDEN